LKSREKERASIFDVGKIDDMSDVNFVHPQGILLDFFSERFEEL
jgi:hypothetical protein